MKKLLCLVTAVCIIFTLTGCIPGTANQNIVFETAEDSAGGFPENDVSVDALKYAETKVNKNGEYTSAAEVAAYLHIFGELPSNFITKNEARNMGWDSDNGYLSDYVKGKSIGGDRFGNYEGILPRGNYKECDIGYHGGKRGAKRLVFNKKGDIYYTNNHYKTFEKLY